MPVMLSRQDVINYEIPLFFYARISNSSLLIACISNNDSRRHQNRTIYQLLIRLHWHEDFAEFNSEESTRTAFKWLTKSVSYPF